MARRTVSSPHSAAWGPGWWWRRRVLYPRVPLPHVSRGRHHCCSPCCCCCWRPGGGCIRCCWRGNDNHLRQRCWGASNECAAGRLVAHSPLSIAATTGGTAASSSGQHPAAPHLNRFQGNIAYALCDETFYFIPLQYLTQLYKLYYHSHILPHMYSRVEWFFENEIFAVLAPYGRAAKFADFLELNS